MLAEAMTAAGVEVEQRTFDSVTHEFFGMAAAVPLALEAQNLASEKLRSAFADE
jgi:hypothetical protein